MQSLFTLVRTAAVLAVVVLPALAARAVSAAVEPLDRWYTLTMQDAPAGWMHARRTVEGDRITTASTMELRVRRGTLDLTFGMSTEFVETDEGKPVRMSATTELGGAPSTQTYVWTDEGVRHTVEGPGQRRDAVLPLPEGTWLTPAAAAEYLAARLRAGADEIVVRTIDPLSGLRVATTTRTGIERVEIDAGGRTAEVFKSIGVADVQPGVETIEHLDENGDAVRLETALGGFAVVIEKSDRATATGRPTERAPELMTSLFIKPSRPIRNAHSTRFAEYVVRATEGDLGDIPSVGYQLAERVDDGAVRVRVNLRTPAEKAAGDLDRETYLAATVYLDSEDSAVHALARRAMLGADGLGPAAVGERLRAFVHRHISAKDLSVGFATASEVARSGEGDCTEHAVLLAALLRAEGIPSRVVGGLIYADQFAGGRDIFGYHAWTQALLPDRDGVSRWVDLDATLPGTRAFSAAHIALSVTSLDDTGPVGGLTELAPLLGRLEIEVVRTR